MDRSIQHLNIQTAYNQVKRALGHDANMRHALPSGFDQMNSFLTRYETSAKRAKNPTTYKFAGHRIEPVAMSVRKVLLRRINQMELGDVGSR